MMAETLVHPKRVPMSREELEKLPEGPPFFFESMERELRRMRYRHECRLETRPNCA